MNIFDEIESIRKNIITLGANEEVLVEVDKLIDCYLDTFSFSCKLLAFNLERPDLQSTNTLLDK